MTESSSPGSTVPLPPHSPAVQAALDVDHLRLLEIGFYISGIVTAFRFIWLLFIAGIFFCIGVGSIVLPHHGNGASANDPPPAFVFMIMGLVFGFIVVVILIFAGLEIYAGRCLKKRRHPLLIQIIAAFYCLSLPWGTALGVFTFIVLNRPSVKSLFERPPLP